MAEIKTLTTKAQAEEAEFLAVLESHRQAARNLRRLLDVYRQEGIDEAKAWELVGPQMIEYYDE